ncbi:MAG: AmmeMemoRadiSam system protein B, partial [Bdellovibrionales bacterium]|nr:AmmeMemoRadiSam system protein B [Bdellovibrionales bacterium]
AYQSVLDLHLPPRKVVLLGPSHQVPVRSLALSPANTFFTPLGGVAIDQSHNRQLLDLGFVEFSAEAHAEEHSLEVQLPFLQMTLRNDFVLLPILVGRATPEQICEALDLVVDGETLILVSTDLSHFLPYSLAQQVDQETIEAVLNFQSEDVHPDRACGAYPLKGLMKFAQQRAWKPELLDLCNSGDTAGGKDRVVGYGALLYHE